MIYVGILFSVASCVIICGAAYVLCKRKRGIIKLGIRKGRDGTGRSSRSKRRYTKLEQHDTGMELRSKYILPL